MIPKTIHYCWLSKEPKPANVKQCIRSWKRCLPGYKIKCWDIDSFDFDSVKFTREALAAKKWAFVSDYIRLYALYTEGGIYMDSDVIAFGTVNDWLKYDLFTGIEKRGDTSDLFVEAAIMGASKGNPLIKKCLDLYTGRKFKMADGSFDLRPIPTMITPLFCEALGWDRTDSTQILPDNSIIFSSDTIANTASEKKDSVVLYHCNNRSWIDRTPKEKLYRLVKNIGLIPVWEKLRTIIR